jgi:hypothetical protein
MDATNALPVETASGSCGQEEMWRVRRPSPARRTSLDCNAHFSAREARPSLPKARSTFVNHLDYFSASLAHLPSPAKPVANASSRTPP